MTGHYYTLADPLVHWENGEFMLEEVIKRRTHNGLPPNELLRELLEILLKQQIQLRELKRRVIG